MSNEARIIDVHHHVFPKKVETGGIPCPEWSIESDREEMRLLGITGALLSLPNSDENFETVRKLNTYLAEISAKYPKEYGVLAGIPYLDTDKALEEIAYSYDILKVDGFSLVSNHAGVYLSDDSMDVVLAELNRRSAVVFVHPGHPAGDNLPSFGRHVSVYEFTFDTTRVFMDLIYKGKLKRYPNIRWIAAHAGGTIPYLSYRLSIASEWGGITQSPEEVLSSLRTLYYELALSTSLITFSALNELVGPSHILYGTDYPIRAKNGVEASLNQLNDYKGFSEAEKQMIKSDTICKLFPRFS
ncbi:amidohydrolase family protein [Clostridium akagii]|uniref:amidohydrolase family protein n=1 Tax=Clostridium akagii TaxID=91623 RepID=UPI00055DD648|nr:amidohydrolase family protein [Clostridium akagii]